MRRGLPLLVLLCACPSGQNGSEDADTGDAGCETSRCGGDPLGEWSVATACLPRGEITRSDAFCPGFECTVSDPGASGTILLNRDETATVELSMTVETTCTIPLDCLEVEACSDLNNDSRLCNLQGEACSCVQNEQQTIDRDGEWRVTGTSYFELEAGSWAMGTRDFCVSGDELTLGPLFEIDLDRFPEPSFSPFVDILLTASRVGAYPEPDGDADVDADGDADWDADYDAEADADSP